MIDASVAVAIAAHEAGKNVAAVESIRSAANNGYSSYAPGVIVTEVLYALCQQEHRGILSAVEHEQAVTDFSALMQERIPPPDGDAALVSRSYSLCAGYGCSRSADSVYIALAELLTATRPTVLLTFDRELPKHAARNAPSVRVQLL